VDPGCYERHEEQQLSDFIEAESLKVKMLVNTHCHIDHVLGNAYVKRTYGPDLYAHPLETPVLDAVKIYAGNYGFFKYQDSTINGELNEGDTISLGNYSFEILWLPGHAPGHIGLYQKDSGFILSGDVLFDGSIGRTDLPGGDFDTLIASIQKKLFKLPPETLVYAGHMGPTTIGKEMKTNPFCRIN
jgi:hydroxyacylglutathione hydrolase